MSHGRAQRGGAAAAAVLQPVLLPPGCQRPDSPQCGASMRGGAQITDVTPQSPTATSTAPRERTGQPGATHPTHTLPSPRGAGAVPQ